jgi:hypothetical protein
MITPTLGSPLAKSNLIAPFCTNSHCLSHENAILARINFIKDKQVD